MPPQVEQAIHNAAAAACPPLPGWQGMPDPAYNGIKMPTAHSERLANSLGYEAKRARDRARTLLLHADNLDTLAEYLKRVPLPVGADDAMNTMLLEARR